MERKRFIMEIREKSWENTSKYLDLKYGCKVVETMWYHEPYRKQTIPLEVGEIPGSTPGLPTT